MTLTNSENEPKPNYYEQKYYPTETIDVVVQASFVSTNLRKPIKDNNKKN